MCDIYWADYQSVLVLYVGISLSQILKSPRNCFSIIALPHNIDNEVK